MIDRALLLDIPDGILLSTSDPLVFEKQVIYVGDFSKRRDDGSVEYRFSVDEATIDHWVKTHDELLKLGLDVPMPVHHTTDPTARAATALSLSKRADSKGRISLFAKFKFKTLKLATDLKDTQVSLYSPPVLYHQDHTIVRPIRHIAFTDYPVIGDLDAMTIAASYDKPKEQNLMTLKELAVSLGLEPKEDADDAAIAAMIKSAFTDAKKPKEEESKLPVVAGDTPVKQKITDPLMISLARDNREMKIDSLVLSHKLTAAEGAELKKTYASEALSLSAESNQAFDMVMKTLGSRDPIIALSGEQTGAQKKKIEDGPMVKSAKKMAGKS